ncbi:MAG: hypothetical protein AAFX80_04485, partial [Cyanobacteria bacterium J06639_18]
EPGNNEISVTLNTNKHEDLAIGDKVKRHDVKLQKVLSLKVSTNKTYRGKSNYIKKSYKDIRRNSSQGVICYSFIEYLLVYRWFI